MKPYICLMILRATALFLSSLMLLSCGGDGDPVHEKPYFEGWERPVFPLETHESVTEQSPETDPREEKNEQTDVTQNTEGETREPCDPSVPLLYVGEALTAPSENGYLYPIVISKLPEGELCALLLLLETVSGEEIYAVTAGEMCLHMNFHYIISKSSLAVLIDGSFYQPEGNESGIILYVSAKSAVGEDPGLVIRAYEYAGS